VKSIVAAPPPPNVKKVDETKSKGQSNTAKPTTAAANNKPESVPDSVENVNLFFLFLFYILCFLYVAKVSIRIVYDRLIFAFGGSKVH